MLRRNKLGAWKSDERRPSRASTNGATYLRLLPDEVQTSRSTDLNSSAPATPDQLAQIVSHPGLPGRFAALQSVWPYSNCEPGAVTWAG